MDVPRHYLLPGELCVSREPARIDTLLGSCVAVCLFNRKLKFGGMNHYMLPTAPQGTVSSGKHGDYSTRILIKKMLSFDSNVQNIDAMVFGGGNVTGHLAIGEGIGAKNIVLARDLLQQFNIRVIKKELGGNYGRKVFFENWTGKVETRRIEKSIHTQEIEKKKKAIAKRKIKVLVVDDSKTIRDIIKSALELDAGIEVVGSAENPYEARELLLEHDPDVICLDVIMPKMDGITFLKKLFLYSPKPVIMISTVVQKGSKIREQADKIGAVDVIDKEELDLYKGIDKVSSILVGKIKSAATVWVRKKTKEELADI